MKLSAITKTLKTRKMYNFTRSSLQKTMIPKTKGVRLHVDTG